MDIIVAAKKSAHSVGLFKADFLNRTKGYRKSLSKLKKIFDSLDEESFIVNEGLKALKGKKKAYQDVIGVGQDNIIMPHVLDEFLKSQPSRKALEKMAKKIIKRKLEDKWHKGWLKRREQLRDR